MQKRPFEVFDCTTAEYVVCFRTRFAWLARFVAKVATRQTGRMWDFDNLGAEAHPAFLRPGEIIGR